MITNTTEIGYIENTKVKFRGGIELNFDIQKLAKNRTAVIIRRLDGKQDDNLVAVWCHEYENAYVNEVVRLLFEDFFENQYCRNIEDLLYRWDIDDSVTARHCLRRIQNAVDVFKDLGITSDSVVYEMYDGFLHD